MAPVKFRLVVSAITASIALALAVVGVATITGSGGNTAAIADPSGPTTPESEASWLSSWVTSPQQPSEAMGLNWSFEGFEDQTVRQVVRPTLSGDQARITLSNLYGDEPVEVEAATIGHPSNGAQMNVDSIRELTFGGKSATRIPAGGQIVSDPVAMKIGAFQPVTVTMYFAEETGPTTFHDNSLSSSWRADGNRVSEPDPEPFTEAENSWYFITDLEVRTEDRSDGVVTVGDSITNGTGSTLDDYRRFPDQLADRLQSADQPRAVLNAGISGNRLVSETGSRGESVLNRFQRDAVSKTGLSTVILLSGVNDLAYGRNDPALAGDNGVVSAEPLIEAYQEIIEIAHQRDLRIIGATILPFAGSPHHTPQGEQVRQEVNDWIRDSAEFDATIDFAGELAYDEDPTMLDPAYDSGDHLHPSNAGYSAMARAVDLEAL